MCASFESKSYSVQSVDLKDEVGCVQECRVKRK